MRHLSLAGFVVTVLCAAACSPQNAGGTDAGPGGTPQADSGTAPGTDGGTTSDGGNPQSDGGPQGEGGPNIGACPNATLFSGDPYFTGDVTGFNPAGQDKLADPPIRNEVLAVAGQVVYYDTDSEI